MVTLQSELRDEIALAKRLKIKVKTLQAWRTRGGGPAFIRVGRLVRYRDEDVSRWLESRRMHSTSESTS